MLLFALNSPLCTCFFCFRHTYFGGDLVAIIDDNYIIGPKEDVFRACEDFAADLTKVGLEL